MLVAVPLRLWWYGYGTNKRKADVVTWLILSGYGDGQPAQLPMALFTLVCPRQNTHAGWSRR